MSRQREARTSESSPEDLVQVEQVRREMLEFCKTKLRLSDEKAKQWVDSSIPAIAEEAYCPS